MRFLPSCRGVVGPDLAGERLGQVQSPTLLLVGSADPHVLELNRRARASLRCTCRLTVVADTWRAVWVMNVRNGQFSEAWAHFDDQYALDSFLNALADLQPREAT